MAKSLTQFVEEVKSDLEKFEADYRAEHAKNPDQYPLVLPNNNAGLWFEFFVDFMSKGGS